MRSVVPARAALRRSVPLLLLVVGLGGAVAVPAGVASSAGPSAATPRAAASAKQTSCASFSRAVKRTTGAKRRTAQAQLRRCKAGNTAAKKALPAIRDGRFVGTRGDGAEVDWTLCANGRYELRTTSDGSTGVSRGSNWRVDTATGRNGSNFTAVVKDAETGLSVGFVRSKGAWKVGVSRSFGEVESTGAVTRTSAASACAAGLPAD